MKQTQKARAGMRVEDETVAKYTAARLFLFGHWAGALLMVASFTQLYWFTFARPGTDLRWVATVGVGVLGLGAWMVWTNRTYYARLDFPFRRKWAVAADVVAGSGVIFWLLFLILLVLTWSGTPVLPER